MKLVVAQILRSRWLAGLVNAGLWLILYFGAARLGGVAPLYREANGSETPAQMPLPVNKVDSLFASTSFPSIVPGTNSVSLFHTRHFIPAPQPSPPPPTTRKIELTYQGYYTVDGRSQALIKMGDKFVVSRLGANLTANLFTAGASLMSLTLTNSAGQTNVLPLNLKKEVEVPIK